VLWVYFDASALIKRYSQEPGTPQVNELFDRLSPEQMTCSVLGILEIISILVRKRNDSRLDQRLFEQAMIEFKAEVLDHDAFSATSIHDGLMFSSLDLIVRHSINATDALILRSALDLRQALQETGQELLLCSSDKRLARAAEEEGLSVFNPESATADYLYQMIEALQKS
jgi:predicted nucleic acid-binding protein